MRAPASVRLARAAAPLLLAVAAMAGTATPLRAHAGRPVEPHDLWTAWSFEPPVVIALWLTGALYALGLRKVWRAAGTGHGVARWEAACFAAGWTALVLALVSPLHALGGALFSAHMAQHEVLMAVAAPLLVLGRPLVPWMWSLPRRWRAPVGGAGKRPWVRGPWLAVSRPTAAWVLHAAALWLWHVPAAYGLAVQSEAVHAAQHATFLGTGLLFWYALLRGRAGRMGYGAAVLYVFGMGLQGGALGAFLTFARTAWYAPYAGTTTAWGLTPLEDQQLAGLIMWVPAGAVYVVAGVWLFAAWLRESERRTRRREAALALTPAPREG
jgi:cytochrome c oxidase assembly factor CtaG